MAENIRRQVRGLAAAVHGAVVRDGSLCPVAAAALQAPGQAPPQEDAAAPRRARGLATAVGGDAPQWQSTVRSTGDSDAGDLLPCSPKWAVACCCAPFGAWCYAGTAGRSGRRHERLRAVRSLWTTSLCTISGGLGGQ